MPDGSIVLMGGYRWSAIKNDVWRFMPVGSSAQNPSHTYTTPGTYQVTLQAYNAGGYNSTRKTGYITIQESSATVAMFRGNPQHTGVFDNGGIEPTNQAKWHFPIGFTYDSSPAVDNGIVYIGGSVGGEMTGQLYAIDTATATERWRFPMERSADSSPAVVDGTIYAGSDYGKLYAINTSTRTVLWNVDDYAGSSPTIDDGMVYFGSL